jgi:hypothetical protein
MHFEKYPPSIFVTGGKEFLRLLDSRTASARYLAGQCHLRAGEFERARDAFIRAQQGLGEPPLV